MRESAIKDIMMFSEYRTHFCTMESDAEVYTKTTWLQRKDAGELLRDYSHKVKWNIVGDKSIDLGCGDGGVTVDILKKYLPENYKSLVGCDVSKRMVRYATETFSDDRTKFTLMDIVGEIPVQLKNNFDHVFSFFVFNWIQDQTKAFQNVHNLLAEGGDCLLLIVGYQPVYNTYRALARNNKWKNLMGDVESYISPYHDSKDPEKDIQEIMTKVGFKNIFVKNRTKSFVYQNFESLKNAMLAILPFRVPDELYDEFALDYGNTLWRENFKNETSENPIPALKDYGSIVVYGSR